MPDPRLQAVVAEIRTQLADARGLAPGTRESLEHLIRDLEALAAGQRGAGIGAGDSLRDRASDAVRRLEASHPALSSTLGNVVEALALFGL